MNFFLDENFSKPVTPFLISKGHQVFDIRSTEFEGVSDKKIFELAQKKQAVFLTTDKDFFHTIPFLYKKHHGIIVVSLRQPNRKSITEKLLFALDHIDLADFESRVLLLKDNHYSLI